VRNQKRRLRPSPALPQLQRLLPDRRVVWRWTCPLPISAQMLLRQKLRVPMSGAVGSSRVACGLTAFSVLLSDATPAQAEGVSQWPAGSGPLLVGGPNRGPFRVERGGESPARSRSRQSGATSPTAGRARGAVIVAAATTHPHCRRLCRHRIRCVRFSHPVPYLYAS
jgi:hypothetical protein